MQFMLTILAAPSNEAVRAAFEAKLREHFGDERITGGQETDYVLGMSVSRDWEKQTLTLSQGGFVRQLLENFGLEEVEAGSRRAVGSPLPLGLKLGANEGRVVPATEFDYLKLVGSLQWLVMSTRPDLAHAAGLLGRFSNAPGEEHVAAAMHVLRYLSGTVDLGITYHGSDEVLLADRRDKLIASVDSDLGGCVDTHKSTSGLVVFLNGGPISWKSKKQSTNSTATLEAEMKAAALVGMELVWLRDLVSELGVTQGCVRVMEDNAGCVALASGQKDTAKSNHFKRTTKYVECLVNRGVIWLDDVPGRYNPADIFTKGPSSSLPVCRYEELRDIVMGRVPRLHLSDGAAKLLAAGKGGANALVGQAMAFEYENEKRVSFEDERQCAAPVGARLARPESAGGSRALVGAAWASGSGGSGGSDPFEADYYEIREELCALRDTAESWQICEGERWERSAWDGLRRGLSGWELAELWGAF